MANYNVDIAVAVKNLNAIKALKRELDAVQKSLDAVKKASKLDAGDESGFRKRRKQRNEEKRALLDQRRLTAELKRAEAGRRAELIKGYREQRQQELSLKRVAEQRMKGLGQYAVSIGPQPDRIAELRKKQQQVRLEAAKSINFQTNFELQLAQKLLGTGKKQLNVKQQITDQQQRQIKDAQALNAQRDKALQKEQKELDMQKKKEQRMRKRRINAAVTGGAFPLLFGGGPLQALGGAVGGGISGEMFSGLTVGLQVLGSAVDRLIAGLVGSANKLALATTETDANIEVILAALGRVGDSSLDYIRSLDTTETKVFALKEANEQLARVVGTEGVENLQKFGDQSRRLQNELTAFFTSLSASVAGLIAQEGRLDEVTKMFEEMRLLDAAKRSAESDPQMALLFAQRKNATGQDRLRLANEILDRQREIEKSADNELEIRKQQLNIFLEQQKAQEQALADQEAADAAAGRDLANQLNAGDSIIETLERQLRAAQARTDQERLTARQQDQQEQVLGRIHESQEGIVSGLLSELFTQQNINLALKEREQLMEKLRKFAETRTPGEITRDNLNREITLLGAKLQGQEKAVALDLDIADALRKGVEEAENLLTLRQQLADQVTVKDIKKDQEDRILLLQAQIKGKEKEYELDQKIQDILDKDLGIGREDLINNEKKIALLEKQVELVKQQKQFYEQVGATVQAGLVNGIMSALEGSKSLSESLAGILRQVAGMFLNVGIGALGQQMGIPGFKPFAEGGYVSGPTRALIGEGGEPEYVIPQSKMRESMARYSRGARGSSVIPGTGGSGTSGEGGGTAVAAPIDVRFTVERINSVDYVTADQFQAGMRRAADEGAKQGEQKTLKRLQMSSGTRKRLGM